jgi:glycine cleavage system aminomethyltransferase T
MAEWMTEGVPRLDGERIDVSGAHISRFQPHAGSRAFTKARGATQYREVYQLIHPNEQPQNQRGLRRSPFYERQDDLGAEFVASGGWEVPQWYEANESLLEEYDLDVPERSEWQSTGWSPIQAAEHRAVREGVGIYDLSRYTGIEITGENAPEFVQRLFANDMDAEVGQVRYAPMCDETGGVLADMAVSRLGEKRFLCTTGGGSSTTLHSRWIREHAPEDVQIDAHVSDQCGLGVWGPNAREVLEPLIDVDLSNEEFGYFRAKECYVDSIPVTALRVSYVGELGWELYCPTEYGGQLWDLLWEAGQDQGMVAFGNGAFLGSLRLEKGFRLWGTDMSAEETPYEAGIGFAVDLDTDFIGREALLEASDSEATRRLACLTLEDDSALVGSGKPIVDGGDSATDSEEILGYTTATDYGYSVDESIAYGYLPAEYAEPGVGVAIEYEGERYAATVQEEPLLDPEREKILG